MVHIRAAMLAVLAAAAAATNDCSATDADGASDESALLQVRAVLIKSSTEDSPDAELQQLAPSLKKSSRVSDQVNGLTAKKMQPKDKAEAIHELINSFPPQDKCFTNAVLVQAEPFEGTAPITDYSMALRESDGFMKEPEELWMVRRGRQIDQMCLQGDAMRTCSETAHDKGCLVGCKAYPADCEARKFWQIHYEPSFSCDDERRIGRQGEGGKWVCDPHRIAKKAEQDGCLVYSIGSSAQYDFEEEVHSQISNLCEIHTVDMKNWTEYKQGLAPPPSYVNYHVYTIGPEPNTPVPTLVEKLGHSNKVIDIFKIDCEGCEWNTFKSWFGSGVYIRQVLVELHHTGDGSGAHEFFEMLFDMGYVVFHKEPNTLGCGGDCVEYAFVRLTPEFSRAWSA